MVWHVNYMPCSVKLWLHQDGVNAGQARTSEALNVWDLVLPLDAKEFSEASGVEVVQLPCVTLVDHPWFTTTEEGGENYGPVNLDLCLYGDASSVPHIIVESAKSTTCFSKSDIHFIINDNVSWECAAKVGEHVCSI